MTDYTELVRALKLCIVGLCEVCPYDGKNDERLCVDGLRMDAANAIEKLQRITKLLESDRDAERIMRLAAEEKMK